MFTCFSCLLRARRTLVVSSILFVSLFMFNSVCQSANDYRLRNKQKDIRGAAFPEFTSPEYRHLVVYNGVGMRNKNKKKWTDLEINVQGEVVKAYLYLVGRHSDPAGDGGVTVKTQLSDGVGNWNTTEVYKKIPVVYTITGLSNYGFVNKKNITGGILEGENRIRIRGYGVDWPDGAVVVAVYKAPLLPDPIDPFLKWTNKLSFLEGADFGYHTLNPPLGPDTEIATFRFQAFGDPRDATIHMFMADCAADRGDEIFFYTNTGRPKDWLKDTDGDGRRDIINRQFDLIPDHRPKANERYERGKWEAKKGAISLEEDKLGRKMYNRGPQLDIFAKDYTVPADHEFVSFQIQSEDPENGDSIILFLAINDILIPAPIIRNPGIRIDKTAYEGHDGGASCPGVDPLQVTGAADDIIENTATTSGNPVDDQGQDMPGFLEDPQWMDTAGVIVTGVTPMPSMELSKEADMTQARPGDNVTFTYTVTNNGNTVLESIEVVDNQFGLVGTIQSLDPGSSAALTWIEPMPYCSDERTGPCPELARAVAPLCHSCCFCNQAVATATVTTDETDLTYCFEIVNSGDLDLADVNLVDNDLGLNRIFPGILAPQGTINDFYETSIGSGQELTVEASSNEVCVNIVY